MGDASNRITAAMLRILIGTATAVALYTGTAHAQFGSANGNTGVGNGGLSGGMIPDGRRRLTPEEAHREQQIEREYRETVNSKIPDKKPTNDPWGNVRSAPAASSAAKQQR
jgi:hypothetical protein